MSRCFPFPPPGYERKHKPDDLDLLKEAKRKEKRHKKEKKDQERKKDKEKKEKDGSDEKHKDKKDRKEKHKDKKEKHKDKKKDEEDRGKDKDKSSISEELTVADKLEDRSGGKLQPKVQSKDRSGFVKEGKSSHPFQGQNGGKPSQSCLPSQFNEESKFVQDLDRRIRDDQKGARSQLPERVAFVQNIDQEIVSRGAIRNSSGQLVEANVDNKTKRIGKKIDSQGVKNDVTASKMAQNLMPIAKAKVEGVAKPLGGQTERRLEYRETYKEAGVIKQGDKQKDRVKDEKERKKNDNAKIKTENKNTNQSQIKTDESIDPGGFIGKRNIDLLNETNMTVGNDENIKKRKEYTNGFLHESEIRPNKMQRSGPHQLIENRRKIESFQTPTKSCHDNLPNSVGVDNGEKVINGLIDSHKPSTSKPKPPTAIEASNSTKVLGQNSHSANNALKVPSIEDLMAEASRRPPHPHYKYLAEVLTVPKMDWTELDEQEWLFNKGGTACNRNMESVREKEDQHVWSEAVHIESADVCALPYVIPY